MKKYIVKMRSSYDDSLIDVIDEFDNYADAESCMDDQSCADATGAEIMEENGMADDEDSGYYDPDDVYYCIEEED